MVDYKYIFITRFSLLTLKSSWSNLRVGLKIINDMQVHSTSYSVWPLFFLNHFFTWSNHFKPHIEKLIVIWRTTSIPMLDPHALEMDFTHIISTPTPKIVEVSFNRPTKLNIINVVTFGPRRPWTTGWWWRDTQISRKRLMVRLLAMKSPLYLT